MNVDINAGTTSRRRAVLIVVVVAILSLSYLTWRYLPSGTSASESVTVSRETTFITEPLTEDCLVDYRTFLNRKYSAGITPETNAAVDYWKAVGNGKEICDDPVLFDRLKDELGTDLFDEGGPYLVPRSLFIQQKQAEGLVDAEEKFDKEFEAAMQGPWNRKDDPLMQEWLELNKLPLRHVLAGTEKPHCYRPLINLSNNESLFGYYMPDTQLARSMGPLLKLRAFRSLHAGEADLAIRDLLAIHKLSRHAALGPTTIEMTVGGAIEVMATHADQQLVNSGQVTAQQLRQYAADLASLPPLTDFQRIINGERMMCLDALQRLPANSDEVTFSIDDLNEALREANDIYDELEASLTTHGYNSPKNAFHTNIRSLEEKLVNANSRTDSLRSFFSGRRNSSKASAVTVTYLFLPGLEAGFERGGFWGETSYRLSVLGTAVAAYQTAESRLPELLDLLVPDYLPELPNDPYTGKPFVYRIDDEGALIYSLGKNLQDDGGKTIEEDEENFDYVFQVSRMDPQ